MKITLFSEELRKCLNAAGLADCGENDAWSYWYHRVMESHIETVNRATATEQAENAELRELLGELYAEYRYMRVRPRAVYLGHETRMREIERRMKEIGVEVDG